MKIKLVETEHIIHYPADAAKFLRGTGEWAYLSVLSDSAKLLLGASGDMAIYYDGTSGYISTAEVAPSDLHIKCGTDKTLVLDETVTNDLVFPIILRTTGAGKPSPATFSGNITQYTFAVNDVGDFNPSELLHDWAEGTAVELHVHWASNGTNVDDRAVKWEVDVTWANTLTAGGTTAFPVAATSSAETTIPAGSADKTHLYTSVATLTMTGGKIGAYLIGSVKRIAAAGTAPTGAPWCFGIGAHYSRDTLGSRTLGTK